ncbi:unnamed protein product, partial [Closterium sp. NIES-54]
MTSLRVLAFDHEGRPIQFDTWLDDLQLYLLSDSMDSVSLFDLASGAATAPPATADSSTCSQWLTRDAVARLAIRNHLPLAECAHFGQHRTAQALNDALVARYSSPATAALRRLLLPYLFPELSAFTTVEDLVSHLCASDARYRAAVPAEDHFLSLDPTSLTVDLLEQHLLAGKTSVVAVGAACGTPRPPFFEGCSPSPVAPSYASAAAADVSVAEDVGAASTSAKRRSSKGKGGRGGGGGSGSGVGGSGIGGGGSSGGGGGGATVGGSGGSGGGGGGSGGSGSSGDGGTGSGGNGARRVGFRGGQRQQQQRRSETRSPQQLREWFLRGASRGSCPYVIRTGDLAGQTCGRLHTQHRYFSRLNNAWRAEFGDDVELLRWADLLKSRIAIFDLDFDAILFAMYALSVSAEGDCYRCVPPDPGIAAAAQGASESGTLPGTAPAEALHTFTLDSGASRCFFRDSTTLTPLPAPVLVRLADPSVRPVVARSSTVLPCPADAMVSTTTPGGQRVSICTCTRTGNHLARFTRLPGSSLYTLSTEPSQVAASAQVSTSRQVAASCSCRLLSHHTLLWHHRLGHPSLPRLRGMHSRLLVSGLPKSLPPLSPSPAPPCLPCVEGRQRAAPHSSSFPLTSAPLQTLHMDVWGPARVSGQSRERYFLLVVDDYTRYTTIFLLRSKGEVPDVLIPWIHTVRLQSFMLPESPQQNGIAEHRIGIVMEVARTSMIHAAAPHFLWPFAVRYAAHQLNLWPCVSLPETSPTLRWTGEFDDASVFRFYHPTSCGVFPSQDVTFDESVPFYRLFPYRSAPPPPPPLFLTPGPPPVDPLSPQGPAPSSVSQVDPLPGLAPVQVAVDSGAARGAASGGAEFEGPEPGGVETKGSEPGGVATGGGEPGGVATGGAKLGGAASKGAESGASGAGGANTAGAGGAGVAARAGVTGGTATTGPGGTRTPGTGAAGTGGVEGAGARAFWSLVLLALEALELEELELVALAQEALKLEALVLEVLELEELELLTLVALCGRDPGSPLLAPSPYTEQSCGLTERHELASHPVSPLRTARCVPRLCPPPVPGTHAMTLRPSSVPLRAPLQAPLESSLPEVLDPESDRARTASPIVSRVLATALTDPSFEFATASALVAELLNLAAACHLDYATALVAESASASPLSIRVSPEGDPDAPDIPTPCSYAEAITGPYSSQWQAAMDAEMALWKSTCTYVDEVPPPGANIVDGMWIFRVKRPQGSPPAFKARYVARGSSQRQEVDYFQTFSPTAKMTTLRVLLHVAAQHNYELHSLDFSTAFLQGSLHEEIWLRRPPGFTDSLPAGTQWSLRRPVYGLRQAPREWHDTLRTTLAALGFAPTTADPSLFLRTNTSLPPFYVLVYVDDLVFATADTEALTLVKLELQKRHTCTDLGELRSSLGLQITRDRAWRTITLTQSHMVHQVLLCFGFQFSSPQPTPLSTSHSLLALPSNNSVEQSGPYPELVGCLITSGMGLVLGGRGPVVLTGLADTSWVDNSAMQRSSQGYTFSLGFPT